MRLVTAVTAIAGAVAVLFVALVWLNAENGFAGCTGTIPLGWGIPILSGLLIGGVGWMLLFRAPHYTRSSGPETRSVPCPSCDKPVLSDWRMCPYCGSVLPRSMGDVLGAADD
jgi:hypothetical protein